MIRTMVLLLCLCGFVRAGQAQTVENDSYGFHRLPDVPSEFGVAGPVAGTHNGALIVGGGANFPVPLSEGGPKVWHDDLWVLLPGEDAWRTVGTLPKIMGYAHCGSTDKGVVVVGGSDSESVFDAAFIMTWDAEAERVVFEDLPPLPTPSALGGTAVIGNTVYVLAGKRAKDDADIRGGFWKLDLDAAEPAWTPLTDHTADVRYKAVTAVQTGPDGELSIYMFSGSQMTRTDAGDLRFTSYTDNYRYIVSSDEWEPIADMPVLDDPRDIDGKEKFAGRAWPIVAGCASAYGDREILTYSGSTGWYILDDAGKVTPAATRPLFATRVLSYDAVSDSWTDAGRMEIGTVTTQAVSWNGLVVIPSGEIKPGIRTPAVQALPLPAGGASSSTAGSAATFATLDYAVLAIYLALMVGVGVYFARKEKTTEDFFLAGRKIPWWAAGLSIFGTQLSAITFMAIPATAYGSDWRRFIGHLMLLPVLVMVIYCFVPFFRRLNITTAYEYLESRFSLSIRLAGSALFIMFQFARMGIVVLLPAIALSAVTGIDKYTCIALMGVLATVYTALGGISAVIWTDVLQVFVLIGGALLCLVVAIRGSGGISASWDIASAADKLHMFDWEWSLKDMGAWVLIFGFLFMNIVPYTTDQAVIQRYLTTPDEKQAARSLWLNLVITIPTGLLFYGLGTALFTFYTSNPEQAALLPETKDQLVPFFVVSHLPAGVAGIVVAGIFAAAMSSLDSSMNSITTAVITDFVDRFQRGENKKDHIVMARWLTVVLGVIGTSAALLLATWEIKYIFDLFQTIIGLFGGSLAGVFLLAVFTKRTNSLGALVGLIAGATATLAVAYGTMAYTYMVENMGIIGSKLSFLLYPLSNIDIHPFLYAGVGTSVCVLVAYPLSIFTAADNKDLTGLTMWTRRGKAA